MLSGLLDMAGDLILQLFSYIITAITSIIRSLLTIFMLVVFDLFEVSRPGIGIGEDVISINGGGDFFYRLFGSSTGIAGSVVGKLVVDILIPVSVALVICLLSWSLFRSIFADKETEPPAKTIARAALALFFALFSFRIMGIMQDAAQYAEMWIYSSIGSVSSTTLSRSDISIATEMLETIVESGESDSYTAFSSITVGIISMIFPAVLTVKYLQVLISYISKYVRLEMIRVFAPAACAAYASESTAEIFKEYIRLYISSLVSVLSTYALVLVAKFVCIGTMCSTTIEELFLWFLLTLGVYQFISNIDAYLDKAGLNNLRNEPRNALSGLGMAVTHQALRITRNLPGSLPKTAPAAEEGKNALMPLDGVIEEGEPAGYDDLKDKNGNQQHTSTVKAGASGTTTEAGDAGSAVAAMDSSGSVPEESGEVAPKFEAFGEQTHRKSATPAHTGHGGQGQNIGKDMAGSGKNIDFTGRTVKGDILRENREDGNMDVKTNTATVLGQHQEKSGAKIPNGADSATPIADTVPSPGITAAASATPTTDATEAYGTKQPRTERGNAKKTGIQGSTIGGGKDKATNDTDGTSGRQGSGVETHPRTQVAGNEVVRARRGEVGSAGSPAAKETYNAGEKLSSDRNHKGSTKEKEAGGPVQKNEKNKFASEENK